MDGAHQPWMLLHAWKQDQFSQLILLCDLMMAPKEGNEKVDKSGRKEQHVINALKKSKCEDVRKELNDAKVTFLLSDTECNSAVLNVLLKMM